MDEILLGKVYYKLQQGVITNSDRYERANCDRYITNCDRYYKMRRTLLQIATGITNCDVITNCDSTKILRGKTWEKSILWQMNFRNKAKRRNIKCYPSIAQYSRDNVFAF